MGEAHGKCRDDEEGGVGGGRGGRRGKRKEKGLRKGRDEGWGGGVGEERITGGGRGVVVVLRVCPKTQTREGVVKVGKGVPVVLLTRVVPLM